MLLVRPERKEMGQREHLNWVSEHITHKISRDRMLMEMIMLSIHPGKISDKNRIPPHPPKKQIIENRTVRKTVLVINVQ